MRKILFLFIISLLFNCILAQTGRPFIRNYPPSEYSGEDQIWNIVQDKRGVMYFAANTCVYEYDGKSWNKIKFKNNTTTTAISLDINSEGTVFVGYVGGFGYITSDRYGNAYIKESAFNEFNEPLAITDVWTTFCIGKTAYFCADEGLFRYNNDSLPKVKELQSSGNPFLMYKSNNSLFVSDRLYGLMKIIGDDVIKIPGMRGVSPWFILPYKDGKHLIGNYSEGLQIIDPNEPDTTKIITKYKYLNKDFIDKTNRLLNENQLYTGATKLKDGKYAIGTIRNGIYIINSAGKITEHINKDAGMQNNTVHALYEDRSGGLWAGLSYGVSKIEISSPFRIFNEKDGIKGINYNIIRSENVLYVTTNLGMFRYEKGKFIGIKEFSDKNSVQVFLPDLYKFSDSTEHLILNTIKGTYSMHNDHVILLNEYSPSSMFQSENDIDKIYFTQDYSLYQFKKRNSSFTEPVLIHTFDGIISGGIEIDKETLWLFEEFKPIQFNVNTKKLTLFHENDEMKDVSFYDLKRINGNLIFITDKDIYTFHNTKQMFAKDTVYPELSEYDLPLSQLIEVSDNKFWILKYQNKFSYIGLFDYSGKRLKIDTTSFKRVNGIHTIYAEGDTIIWAIASEKIYRFNANIKKEYKEKRKVLFRKISLLNDSVIFSFGNEYMHHKDEHEKVFQHYKIDYKYNYVSFEYALPSFDDESTNEYSYKLVGGKTEKWSKWNNESFKEYTNLHEGEYIFKVKARNIYQSESEISEFRFEILAPWYRTWWSYIIYVLILTLFIYIAIKLNARRLEYENTKLENIVKQRTAEISTQKEEIQTQADHLEEINIELSQKNEEINAIAESLRDANLKIRDKNHYIIDSINYAKKIQTAVLPSQDLLKETLNDYFLIYRPKDIVGGDFYYIREVNEYLIIAVADCTGHGVPGGFLSMMGYSFLNEIVRNKHIERPSQALEEMRVRMKSALKQKNYFSGRNDGIDIALCAFNKEKGILQYSGANIPAYIIRADNRKTFEELKPDIQPVGIHYNEKPFKYHEINIHEGDTLYLFSDGIYDQLGGEKNKKYLLSKLKESILNISDESLKVQRRIIFNDHIKWKGMNKQVDDILIMGFRYHN